MGGAVTGNRERIGGRVFGGRREPVERHGGIDGRCSLCQRPAPGCDCLRARAGYGSSALGLSEETVELPAGGVEGALLIFPAVVDQRATILVYHIADELFCRKLSQRRVIVHLPDDLSAQYPQVIDVFANGLTGKIRRHQMLQERSQTGNEFFSWRQVFFPPHPGTRPISEIEAVAG